ncbi:MAG TPA: HD domain-containing protein, partial [Elusimicrobiales bacterium]|nr:HD domain-containing protein [Elusimicrobiales bacterium]
MKASEYVSLSRWFNNYADGFRDANGKLHPLLELKRCHSLRVARNAELIVLGNGDTPAKVKLAKAAGLLHDVGRFTQFVVCGSFWGGNSLDHGAHGYRVLKEKAATFFQNDDELEQLLCAVRYHNRKSEDIPVNLDTESAQLLKLVRDADKLDIIGIVLRCTT